jgi:hypothetical protein
MVEDLLDLMSGLAGTNAVVFYLLNHFLLSSRFLIKSELVI